MWRRQSVINTATHRSGWYTKGTKAPRTKPGVKRRQRAKGSGWFKSDGLIRREAILRTDWTAGSWSGALSVEGVEHRKLWPRQLKWWPEKKKKPHCSICQEVRRKREQSLAAKEEEIVLQSRQRQGWRKGWGKGATEEDKGRFVGNQSPALKRFS